MIALRLAQPSFHRRHHVEAYRAGAVDADDLRAGEQKDRLAFLVLPSGPHDVVHVDLMSNAVDVLDLMAIEGDFGVPQSLLLRDVGDVEEQPESVVIFEAIVYVALCKNVKERIG